MRHWGILKTQPRCEKVVSDKVVACGYETYLPQCKVQIVHARKRSIEKRALFSTHLFVFVDPEIDQWRTIERLPGTIGFIKFGATPSRMKTGALEAIMKAVEIGVFDFDTLAAGQTVRVVEGPFSGVIGKIASLDSRVRQRALIDLVTGGRSSGGASISVPVDNLERII